MESNATLMRRVESPQHDREKSEVENCAHTLLHGHHEMVAGKH